MVSAGTASCVEHLSIIEEGERAGGGGQGDPGHMGREGAAHRLKLHPARLGNMNEGLPCLGALGGEVRRPRLELGGIPLEPSPSVSLVLVPALSCPSVSSSEQCYSC